MPKPILARQELYELVWTDAVRTIAASYGISDVWLKKVCARANVPTPDRGYWAKLAAGKPVVRVRLPLRDPGMPDLVPIAKSDNHWRYDPVAELAEPIPDPPVFTEPLEDVRARIAKRVGKVLRCKDLSSPCPVVRKLLQKDESRREKQREWSWSEGALFDNPFEARRLRVLNAIALALPRVGGGVDVSCQQGRKLSLHVGSQRLDFTLDHPDAKPDRWGEWKTRPGPLDVLRLDIPSRHEDVRGNTWIDTQPAKLEDQLTEIVIAIGVAGEANYREGQVKQHAWLLKRRADNEAEVIKRRVEAERLAEERRLKAQKARRERLLAQAKDWRTAHDIRGFVHDVLTERGTDREALHDWAAWARSEADALDPALNGSLTRVDFDTP